MRPYDHTVAHLEDELRRLDIMLRLYLEEWWTERGADADRLWSPYVSDEKVDRLLDVRGDRPGTSSPFDSSDASSDRTSSDRSASDGSTASPPPNDPSFRRDDATLGRGDEGDTTLGGVGVADGNAGSNARRSDRSVSRSADDRGRGGSPELLDRLDALTRQIRARERATVDAGRELRLVAFVQTFGLDDRHRDALLLALAPELDRKYETVYAYLQDDIAARRPTVELSMRVLRPTPAGRTDGRATFTSHSPLVRNRLLSTTGPSTDPLASRTVRVEEGVVTYLLGIDEVADPLEGIVTLTDPEDDIESLAVGDECRAELSRISSLADRDRPPMAYLHGPYGVGKATAASAMAATAGRPLLSVDAEAIDGDEFGPIADLLVREARFRGATIHVENVPQADASQAPETGEERARGNGRRVGPERLAGALDAYDGPIFLSSEELPPPRLGARLRGHRFATVALPPPTYERRRALWREVDSLPDGAEPAELAATFRLTPGGIEDAIATARTIAGGDELTAEAVYAACRAHTRATLGSLAQRIEPGYAWDDIVLPDRTLAHLEEIAAHLTHRGTVYSEWGFASKYSLGNGLNVLFHGPSGTGKTMAAEIVAGDAGLDLYKIDLSGVVSKYVGETESKLRAVFDEAETSDAVLFFDEADALFGERSEVSDAQDRYANVEVSYLLQRMEEHDGAVVLATNLEEHIDEAFRRRLNASVEFPLPDREARREIWRRVFPADVPLGKVDVEFLSSFELTGGNVKNAALTAAFLAAEEESPVEMCHLVRGTWRELRKAGRLVDPADFGEYREELVI